MSKFGFKKSLIALLALCIVLALGYFFLISTQTKPSDTTIKFDHRFRLAEYEISVILAEKPEEKSRGLSGFPSLKEDQGMLFDFTGQNLMPTFWMKDMLFSIDIVWISQGKVTGFEEYIPKPFSNNDADLKLYTSPTIVDYVLELPAGWVRRHSAKKGSGAILIN